MPKLQSKALVKPFASEEENPIFKPTPMGEWAGGGAVTPSLDPEVLLQNISQGITRMVVQTDTSEIVLPPASDIAGLYYSFTYFLKALQQSGIAEYSSAQDYYLNDITKSPNGSKIYRSLTNNNIGNSLVDTTKWEELDLLALRQATISQRGTLQIATISDIQAGADNTKALTIANLRASDWFNQQLSEKLDAVLAGEVKAIARQNFNDFTTSGGTGTWLYCDGRALSTTAYPKLFAVCGYAYGGSEGSFKIPDLRGRVISGASIGEPIAKTEGNKVHVLTINEMPAHSHSVTSLPLRKNDVDRGTLSSSFSIDNVVSVETGSKGGSQPHNNMQPTIYLPYFIYAV